MILLLGRSIWYAIEQVFSHKQQGKVKANVDVPQKDQFSAVDPAHPGQIAAVR